MKTLLLTVLLLSGCAIGDGPDRYDWITNGLAAGFKNANAPGGAMNPINVRVMRNR